MASSVYRYGATIIPGSFVTLLLLLFMMVLIQTGIQDPVVVKKIPLDPIFNVDQPVPPKPKPERPEKLPEAVKQPEIARIDNTITDRVILDPGTPIYTPDKPVISKQLVDTSYIPVYVPQPRFPIKALKLGINGYAVVDVTITTTGSVKNPSVLEEYPAGYGFGKAALKAAGKLKYQPKVVGGKAVEVPGVLYKYSFAIED